MLTARAWWLFLPAIGLLGLGLAAHQTVLIVLALGIFFWLGYEGVRFNWAVLSLRRRLTVTRTFRDARGPVRTLIAGGVYTLEVRLELTEGQEIPVIVATDMVPYAVTRSGGTSALATRLDLEQPLVLLYQIRCPKAGVARFEGVQIQLTDPQGFFYLALFLREALELPILPLRGDVKSRASQRVPSNRLPPPGLHRLHKSGASSELLDLRDYQPGDSPRTIAWKVSARRDKLITREFESEVPLKCTLFVDTSNSVRLLSAKVDAQGHPTVARPLHRLVDIASGVVQAGLNNRDLVGLCLFDEASVRYLRPDRAGQHRNEMLQTLAASLRDLPEYARVDPDELLPLAFGFASRVYPDLLDASVNSMPFWVQWVTAFPGAWRRSVGMLRYFHRSKGSLLFLMICVVPALVSFVNLVLSMVLSTEDMVNLFIASAAGTSTILGLSLLAYLGVTVITGKERRIARWRKLMAALLAERYDLGAAGIEAMMEDEDLLGLMLQKFLNEHQVPFRVPLYDERGAYLHSAPEKVRVLAAALQESIRRGQDSELFVLMADLLELDEHLDPLLRAIRLARSRHHQVLVLIPWPPALPPPGSRLPPEPDPKRLHPEAYLEDWIRHVTAERFHGAYHRLQQRLARLGVEVACAEEGEPVALVLNRLDRLRLARRAF